MKIKWYLSTLVVVFSFLGICNNKISLPNQEILLQFNSEEVTTEQSQKAIATIKQQLRCFGVDYFHVSESGNGELRISYHSSMDVESIKKSLSEDGLGLDLTSLNPNDKDEKSPNQNHKDYNLDVYELQKTTDSNNSAGKYIIVVKQDYDRYISPSFYPYVSQHDFCQPVEFEKLANNSFTQHALATNSTSYIIPEVRAGPTSAKSL